MAAGLSDDAEFAFEKEILEQAIFFRLKGSINSSNTPSIRAELVEAAKDNNLLIDMNEVTMLTSTGVGTLFEITDMMSKSEKKLVIINPSDRVKQVIDLTGFAELFKVSPSRETALTELS